MREKAASRRAAAPAPVSTIESLSRTHDFIKYTDGNEPEYQLIDMEYQLIGVESRTTRTV